MGSASIQMMQFLELAGAPVLAGGERDLASADASDKRGAAVAAGAG